MKHERDSGNELKINTYILWLLLFAVLVFGEDVFDERRSLSHFPTASRILTVMLTVDPSANFADLDRVLRTFNFPSIANSEVLLDSDQMESTFLELAERHAQRFGSISHEEMMNMVSLLKDSVVASGLGVDIELPSIRPLPSSAAPTVHGSYDCDTHTVFIRPDFFNPNAKKDTQVDPHNAAHALFVLSHELAHIQVHRCFRLNQVSPSETFQEMTEVEAVAQAAALQALARIVYTAREPEVRSIARTAFVLGLAQISRLAGQYNAIVTGVLPVAQNGEEIGAILVESHQYGILPVRALHRGRITVKRIPLRSDGFTLYFPDAKRLMDEIVGNSMAD